MDFSPCCCSSPFAPRKEFCFRGAKDDKETPQASTPATPKCNLQLNYAKISAEPLLVLSYSYSYSYSYLFSFS